MPPLLRRPPSVDPQYFLQVYAQGLRALFDNNSSLSFKKILAGQLTERA